MGDGGEGVGIGGGEGVGCWRWGGWVRGEGMIGGVCRFVRMVWTVFVRLSRSRLERGEAEMCCGGPLSGRGVCVWMDEGERSLVYGAIWHA